MTRYNSIAATVVALAVSSFILQSQAAVCAWDPTNAPGGFVEPASSTALRPRLAPSQINAMLPQRGGFTFPEPYLTQGIRITNGTDCGGTDCVLPVGYSYWRNINNHTCEDTLLLFLGLDATRGGTGPTLFEIDKLSGAVTNQGPLFAPSDPLFHNSGEGWYFSANLPHALYLFQGSRLQRLDVLTSYLETVFDAAPSFGSDKYIWQAHSSDDDRVHSATLRDNATSEMLGCLVYREDTAQFQYYPKQGLFDECHVDKSGRWLVMLDNVDGQFGEDNRIIDLYTGEERVLLDQEGAAGHADLGYGYMLNEDDWGAQPGLVRLWKFDQPLVPGPDQGRVVYHTTNWSADAGHITHGNALDGPPEEQFACSSNATQLDLPRSNEIICYRADGSLEVVVVAPVLTDMNASGGGDAYSKRPKGSLDITGQYFIWTTNLSGNRLDAFLVRVPSQHLLGSGGGGGAADTTPPVLANEQASAIGSAQATIVWTTNEPADSRVDYGPTIAYGSSTTLNGTLVTSHSQLLTSLLANTVYHYRVRSRDAAGNLAVSTDHTFQTVLVSGGPVSAVWTNATNCAVDGGSLQKTGGADGIDDARAVTVQELSTGDGYLEFTAAELTKVRFGGLNAGSGADGWASIDFAIRLGPWNASTGIADVRENGVWQTDTVFVSGDTFRIAVVRGVVLYSKNGVVFHTSSHSPSYPLRGNASIFDLGGTIGSAVWGPLASPPPEVWGNRFFTASGLQWDAAPGVLEYHIYRGALAQATDNGSCRDDLDGNRTDTQLVDTQQPAPGTGYFYLITAETADGEGSLGFSSFGPRVASIPCN